MNFIQKRWMVFGALAVLLIVLMYVEVARERGFSLDRVHVLETSDTRVVAHVIFNTSGTSAFANHYVEHLAWLSAVGDQRNVDQESNAWTRDEAVGYWLSGAAEDLTELLETLSGVFDPIDLPREIADTERDIVLREYEYVASSLDAQANVAMNAFLYQGNAIVDSVIGTPE